MPNSMYDSWISGAWGHAASTGQESVSPISMANDYNQFMDRAFPNTGTLARMGMSGQGAVAPFSQRAATQDPQLKTQEKIANIGKEARKYEADQHVKAAQINAQAQMAGVAVDQERVGIQRGVGASTIKQNLASAERQYKEATTEIQRLETEKAKTSGEIHRAENIRLENLIQEARAKQRTALAQKESAQNSLLGMMHTASGAFTSPETREEPIDKPGTRQTKNWDAEYRKLRQEDLDYINKRGPRKPKTPKKPKTTPEQRRYYKKGYTIK